MMQIATDLEAKMTAYNLTYFFYLSFYFLTNILNHISKELSFL